ncbi:MAG TPA: YggT family protein [Anaerolineales bacterium]|jgi:YggT family protein|nr:YggT family protein [Anaerolineales bacterium]
MTKSIIIIFGNLVTYGVIVHVLLGYFVSPYHPAREFTARLFEPLLAPIRRMLPQTGMLDFSPLVLIILVQLVEQLILSAL